MGQFFEFDNNKVMINPLTGFVSCLSWIYLKHHTHKLIPEPMLQVISKLNVTKQYQISTSYWDETVKQFLSFDFWFVLLYFILFIWVHFILRCPRYSVITQLSSE